MEPWLSFTIALAAGLQSDRQAGLHRSNHGKHVSDTICIEPELQSWLTRSILAVGQMTPIFLSYREAAAALCCITHRAWSFPTLKGARARMPAQPQRQRQQTSVDCGEKAIKGQCSQIRSLTLLHSIYSSPIHLTHRRTDRLSHPAGSRIYPSTMRSQPSSNESPAPLYYPQAVACAACGRYVGETRQERLRNPES